MAVLGAGRYRGGFGGGNRRGGNAGTGGGIHQRFRAQRMQRMDGGAMSGEGKRNPLGQRGFRGGNGMQGAFRQNQ
jgi:hypothetical protein